MFNYLDDRYERKISDRIDRIDRIFFVISGRNHKIPIASGDKIQFL